MLHQLFSVRLLNFASTSKRTTIVRQLFSSCGFNTGLFIQITPCALQLVVIVLSVKINSLISKILIREFTELKFQYLRTYPTAPVQINKASKKILSNYVYFYISCFKKHTCFPVKIWYDKNRIDFI